MTIEICSRCSLLSFISSNFLVKLAGWNKNWWNYKDPWSGGVKSGQVKIQQVKSGQDWTRKMEFDSEVGLTCGCCCFAVVDIHVVVSIVVPVINIITLYIEFSCGH